jgi:hypothetical protein
MSDKDHAGLDLRTGIDRRGFLQIIGTAAGTLALPRFSLTDEKAQDAFDALLQATHVGITGSVNLIRPRDLLNLQVEFLNLAPRERFLRAPTLHAVVGDRPSFLVMTLPGQHVLEERSGGSESTPSLPVKAFLSVPTSLVFRVPHELLPLDFVTESLLRWKEFELVVRPAGLAMCMPAKETAIVFSSRLSFVPARPAGISTTVKPRVIDGRTELWRADLADAPLRAIWTPDHQDAACDTASVEEAPDFDAPLQTPGDRRDIALSARRPSPDNPHAHPVDVRALALSPLGAWADIRGEWDPPASGDLIGWENRSTMGRDHYVKVARSGYLYPWGHKASLVEVTDRRILPSPAGADAAYLRYRFYLVVTQPVRVYPDPDAAPESAYPTQPFRTVEFITLKTPTLDAWRPGPASAIPDGNIDGHGRKAFWPKVGGTEFRFAIETRDWTGRLASTEVTAIFVGRDAAQDVLADVAQAYRDERSANSGMPVDRPGLRTAGFRGQPVAFAVENERDDTTLETASVTFGAKPGPNAAADCSDWPFSAVMSSASVRVPSVAHIAGFAEALDVAYDDRFDPAHPERNQAELFLVAGNAPHLDFAALGADKSGGVATPNMRIGGVSRTTGVVGDDIDNLADGNFQPGGFFPADAELLGGVKMGDVLEASPVVDTLPFCDGSNGGERIAMPKFSAIYSDGDEAPARACFQLDWQTTKLKSFPPLFEVGEKTCLRIQTTVCVGGGDSVEFTQQRGRVTDFKFTVPKVVRLSFVHFDFERVAGRPLRVDPKFSDERGIELLDALKWIDTLTTAIKTYVKGLVGGGEGPGIGDYFDYSISPRAVRLFFKYPLPDLPLGALTVSNMQTAIGIELPLLSRDGTLVFFDFSTRKNPFGVTVPPFGGGGFFGVGVATSGELRRIEGAIEFGGRFDVAIAGASGEVFVMVGIYYSMKADDKGNRQELAAYMRAGGSLRIIELITVSVEFYLVLMYIADESSPDFNSLCGEATVTVVVSIAFFSTGVELTFRKCFKGSEADAAPSSARGRLPTLIDNAYADSNGGESPMRFSEAVNGREGWREYWQAFAI